VIIPPLNDLDPNRRMTSNDPDLVNDSVFTENSNSRSNEVNFGGLPKNKSIPDNHNNLSWLSTENSSSGTGSVGTNIKKAKESITEWYRSKFKSRRNYSSSNEVNSSSFGSNQRSKVNSSSYSNKGDTNFGYKLSDS
jgi:hypothetical protein